MDWRNRIDRIQNKVKFQFHASKLDDLDKIQGLVQQFDPNGSGCLNKVSFGKFTAACGIFLTSQELREVYNIYDKNRDGMVHYQEFLQFIRTTMSENRLSAVKHAFNFLDRQGNGSLPLDSLLKAFRPADHPRVRIRDKTEQQVMGEFSKAITRKSSNGTCITEAEFLEYYADVNATLPYEKENYFVDLVLKSWGVTSGDGYVSPERLAELENIIFEKVRQKTLEGEDEGETVLRAFRYFDLNNTGRVCRQSFNQALNKFGCVFLNHELQALFSKYDSNNTGTLNYQEFSQVFALMGSGKNPNYNPVFSILQSPPEEVLARVRSAVMSRGSHGVRGLTRCLLRADKNNNNFLSRHEFTWALKENGHALTKTELNKLFRYFDMNGDDRVCYTSFMRCVRGGEMNQTRRDCVMQMWGQLAGSCDAQSVNMQALMGMYRCDQHPRVLNGSNTVQQVQQEFMNQFDCCRQQGCMSMMEFGTYYQDVSCYVDCDNAFCQMVQNSWNCGGQQEQEDDL